MACVFLTASCHNAGCMRPFCRSAALFLKENCALTNEAATGVCPASAWGTLWPLYPYVLSGNPLAALPVMAGTPLEPMVGLEPTAYRLQGDCSTAELQRHYSLRLQMHTSNEHDAHMHTMRNKQFKYILLMYLCQCFCRNEPANSTKR